MLYRLISLIGSFASILSFALVPMSGDTSRILKPLLFLVGVALFLWTLKSELFEYKKRKSYPVTKTKRIVKYMNNWISSGGRIAIFTNDLTWADQNTKRLLIDKSGKNEVSIYAPQSTPLTEELKQHGAHIYTYSDLGYTPRSRFTIINMNRGDEQIAVGGRINDRHIIQEYGIGEHPYLFMANDLINIIKRHKELTGS